MVSFLIKFSTAVIGIIFILRHLVLGVMLRNSLHFKRSGKVFLIILGVFTITTSIEIFLRQYRNRGLILYAWREAPIGGVWLKLLENDKFQLGYLPTEKVLDGNYSIKGDTLYLKGEKPVGLLNESNQTSFLIKNTQLLEINKTNIGALQITTNDIRKN